MSSSESGLESHADLKPTTPMDTEKSPVAPLVGPPDFEKAPDGGLRAWLVAAAGFCFTFCCLGITMCFGVFQQYYSAHQLSHESPDKIAWIGSIAGFIQFVAGAVSGPLFDRYGMIITYPAAILYIIGLMMLSLCTKYFHFILVQGLVIGISTSMIQLPAFAATSQFFDKKRGAALGIVVSGSSIGGVVFPIAFSKMLNDSTLDFGWSVRVMGFAVIPLVVFASLTMRARLPPRKTNFLLPSAFRDRKYVCLVVALALMFLGMNTPIYFIPTYAVSKGVDPVLASYLIAIINGSSTFGRIIPGFLADKLGRFNVFAFGGIATGVCILCLNHIDSTPGLVAYCVFFGFSSGMIISGGSTALTVCAKNPQDFGTYMGMGMAAASVSVLIGPPINGALIDRYNGYDELAIFSGVACLVGGCVATISKTSMPGGIFENEFIL